MNRSEYGSDTFHWKLDLALVEKHVRFAIFVIAGACAGLPALVWSVSDLIHHRKNGHRIPAFIIILLLTDFVELFLSPYILIKYLLYKNLWYKIWTYRVLFYLWWSSRDCGLLLNNLVALEGIVSVRFPVYTASVFSSPYFICFHIFVFLFIIIGRIFLYRYYHECIVIFMLAVSMITWIISCSSLCSADRHSHASMKPDHYILFVFIFTLLVVFLPYSVVQFYFNYSVLLPTRVFFITWFLMSVRLISDPLLCVLVCRQNISIQTSQKPEETSLV